MIQAYDSILLNRAGDTLGRMLDYSVYSLRYDIAAMIDLFIASGIAALFERGDIRTIAGMSGIELAYEVLEKSSIVFERAQPRYTRSLSAEYWCGYVLAHIQWETGLSYDQIIRSFSVPGFVSEYGKSRLAFLDSLPLDTGEKERTEKILAFGSSFAEEAVSKSVSSISSASITGKAEDTSLKRIRIRNGLSQSQLAKACGIPVRTIQQYEQRQKDINKARAEYLIALARALNCDPSQLLNR